MDTVARSVFELDWQAKGLTKTPQMTPHGCPCMSKTNTGDSPTQPLEYEGREEARRWSWAFVAVGKVAFRGLLSQ